MFRTNLQRIKTEREKEERHKTIIQVLMKDNEAVGSKLGIFLVKKMKRLKI